MRHAEAERLDRQIHLERSEHIYRARNGLLGFIRHVMPEYEVNWHHRLACQQLNRLVKGEITRVIMVLPPRAGKSLIVSRHLPAYFLGRNPDTEIIAASYGSTLALNNSRDVQRIMMAPSYREVFPDTQLADSVPGARRVVQSAEQFRVVGRKGSYTATSVGASATGFGSDLAIIDDPVRDWQDAHSRLIRERIWEWYTSVLYTRQSKQGRIVCIMTRWHEADLAGRLIAQARNDPEADQWTVISLPAINEAGPSEFDPRQIGEPLWPERFPLQKLNTIRRNSERVWVSLYQGRPAPPDGDIVKRQWWRRYAPADLPDKFDMVCLSVDPTFSDSSKGDFNCFQVWGKKDTDVFLLHQVNARLSFTHQLAMLQSLCKTWPLTAKFIENTANGAALIDACRKAVPGLVPVTPRGSKLARAEAVTPYIQAGNVHIPRDGDAPWVEEFIEQWIVFPNGTFDDIVDCSSQALAQMLARRQSRPVAALGPTKESRWRL